jgi:hypothetical protein
MISLRTKFNMPKYKQYVLCTIISPLNFLNYAYESGLKTEKLRRYFIMSYQRYATRNHTSRDYNQVESIKY